MELSKLVSGVGHLGIKVSDMDSAVSFYEKNLGFLLFHRKVVVDTLGSALEASFLRLGNLVLELVRPASAGNGKSGNGAGVWDHYAVDAPDFDACVQSCMQKGMKLDQSTQDGSVYYDGIGAKGVLGANFIGPSMEVIELCHNCSKDYVGKSGLQGWSHLAVKVRDLERTSSFYRKLGFRPCDEGYVDTPQGTMKLAFLALGDFQIEVIEVCPSMRDDLNNRKNGVIDHLALEVSDVTEAWRICQKEGISLITPVVRELSLFEHGVRYLMVEGPDGEVIELCQKLSW